MRIRNLTGHRITFVNGDMKTDVEAEGRASVENRHEFVESVLVHDFLVVPLYEVSEQEITNLPDAEEGVLIVVSGLVAAVASRMGRTDVVSPGRVDRENGGRVTGARSLLRIAYGEKGEDETVPSTDTRPNCVYCQQSARHRRSANGYPLHLRSWFYPSDNPQHAGGDAGVDAG